MTDATSELITTVQSVLAGMGLTGTVTAGPGEGDHLLVSVQGEDLDPMVGRDRKSVV